MGTMQPVKYEGNVPVKLRMACDRKRHAIKECTYHNGWATDDGMAYEVVLRDGFKSFDEVVHTLIDTRLTGILNQIKWIEKCDCVDCKRGLPK